LISSKVIKFFSLGVSPLAKASVIASFQIKFDAKEICP
jgi:hypothetical protein